VTPLPSSALAERVREAASSERRDALVAAVLASLPLPDGPALALRAQAAESVRALHDLAAALGAPDDVGDLYRSLAAFWLERRFEWERCNQVANYHLCRTGQEPPPALLGRAAVASGVLAWIVDLCSPDQLRRLGDVTLEVLDDIRPDVGAGRFGGVGSAA
jgi:hypothetical protein